MAHRALPRIRVLATGGTIAGMRGAGAAANDYDSGVLSAERVLASVPSLAETAVLDVRQIANIGSEDMTEKIWFDLARAVRRAVDVDGADGVVILHGTDTMEETGFFLDALAEWKRPVVLTGSMRPADALGADGPMNAYNAVRLAASASACGRGVLVCMNDRIHAARYACKMDTAALDAFQSSVAQPLGRMTDGVAGFFLQPPPFPRTLEFSINGLTGLPKVAILYGHAGQGRELVDAVVAAGVRGIVFAGVGMGQIHREAVAALADAVKKGVIVVRSSRVGNGPVPAMEKYRRHGFIAAGTLNPQKARVLLQLSLTASHDVEAIRELFSRM